MQALARTPPQQAGHSFHPYLAAFRATVGGIVSVALSLGSPPVAVSNCLYPVLPGLSSCQKQVVV